MQKTRECCHGNHITEAPDIQKILVLPWKQSCMTTKYNYFKEMISHTFKRKVLQLLYLSYDCLLPHLFLYHKTEWGQRLLAS